MEIQSDITYSSHVLHRKIPGIPHTVESASGLHITLKSARQIIDASGGAAVACLGHGRHDIADAVQHQMSKFAYAYSGSNLTSQPAEELARLLLQDAFEGRAKAFFCNSGSEATEAALKLALQFFQENGCATRTHVVSRRLSYHGNSLCALSVSGIQDRRKPYESWMSPNVTFTESCHPYRGKTVGESDQDYVDRLAANLDSTFQRIGPEKVAAFIMETVGGSSVGCVVPPRGYLNVMAAVCRKYGILLILDEVMCGMGRTGALHAWQLEEDFMGPDIQTVGKALGGGFIPLSAVLVSKRVVDAVYFGSGRVAHSHTFQAHPVACAAALAVQIAIRSEGLVENVRIMGLFLGEQLRHVLADLNCVGDIRGRGLFWAVEFAADRETKTPMSQGEPVAPRVVEKAFELGLGIQCGISSNSIGADRVDCVVISPPYNVTKDEVVQIVLLLGQAISKVT